jgi:hypothetical protein
MNTNDFLYPFDPTGVATTNLIVGERQVINPPGMMDYYYIVPKAGPYFRESMVLTLYPSGRVLIEGIDYVCTHLFHAATHSVGQGIYGSVLFYDHTLTGTVSLKYQTIGGDWTISESKILEVLTNVHLDPRLTTWEQVVDLPYQFPPIAHEFNINDFVGADDIVNELTSIRQAILLGGAGALGEHISDKNNPHQVTKAQVGLSLVENYPPSTTQDATLGVANNTIMTPLRTRQAIEAMAFTRINEHSARLDNPHEVTKAQVNLGSVENLPLSSRTEAEQGATHARYMTPIRVKEAITFQLGNAFNAFVAQRDNPHQVTKTQVGLSSLENYPVATVPQAQLGTATNVYMTANTVREAVAYQVGDTLATHVTNFDNPHNVDKNDIGLSNVRNLTTATREIAEAGDSDDYFMTPIMTRFAIQKLADNSVGAHSSRTDNPHNVTKAQVGLSQVANYGVASFEQAQLGIDTNVYMTASTTRDAIAFQIGDSFASHLADRNNPHSVTKTQVGLGSVRNLGTATRTIAEAGDSDDYYMTPIMTRYAIQKLADSSVGAHASMNDNPHAVTKDQVGLGSVPNWAPSDEADARLGASDSYFMSPLRVHQAIDEFTIGVRDHVSETNNPHNVTAAQVGSYTVDQTDILLNGKLGKTEAATDTTRAFGMSLTQLQSWVGDQIAGDASKVYGLTAPQLTSQILSGTSASTLTFGGMNASDYKEDILNIVNDIPKSKAAQQTYIPPIDLVSTLADPDVYIAPSIHWSKIADVGIDGDRPVDISLILVGGKSDVYDDVSESPSVRATVSFENFSIDDQWVLGGVKVEHLNGFIPSYELYAAPYTDPELGNRLVIWIKDTTTRNGISVTDMSQGSVRLFSPSIPSREQDLDTVGPADAEAFVTYQPFQSKTLADTLTAEHREHIETLTIQQDVDRSDFTAGISTLDDAVSQVFDGLVSIFNEGSATLNAL